MLSTLKTMFSRLRKDEKGVTLVEYGIALVLAISVGTALLSTLATGVNDNIVDAADIMDNRVAVGGTTGGTTGGITGGTTGGTTGG